MKKFLLILTGLLLIQVGFAQTTNPIERKSSLIFSGGAAIPVGPFATTTSEESGMAKTGYTMNLQYARQFKGFGIGIQGMYSSHSLKNEMEGYGLKFSNWNYYGITAGLISSYPIKQQGKFFVDLKALAGAGFVKSPSISYSGEGETVTEPARNSTAFLGDVGIGLRYKISSKAFLYGAADWISMQPKFSYNGEQMTQKMSAVNLHAGLGFSF